LAAKHIRHVEDTFTRLLVSHDSVDAALHERDQRWTTTKIDVRCGKQLEVFKISSIFQVCHQP